MIILTRQNVGGTNYLVAGVALSAVCNTAASSYIKQISDFDGDTVENGMQLICAFTNGSTAGSTLTIYSSDQEHYYTDTALTIPFVNDAPAGCFTITYTGEGNAYDYVSFPAIDINGTLLPVCTADGSPVIGNFCSAGDTVMLSRLGNKLYINSGSVRSVNGKTGIVVLTASDIPYDQGTVQTALAGKQNTLTFDNTPTPNSINPVTSNGIATAIASAVAAVRPASFTSGLLNGYFITKLAYDANTNDWTVTTQALDTAPTAGSTSPVTSGGIKTALNTKQDKLTFDTTPTLNSDNPVTSGGIKAALDNKQNTLTFDNTPTLNSSNPVTSDGIKRAIDDSLRPIKAHNTSISFTVHDGAYIDVQGMVYDLTRQQPYLTGCGKFYVHKTYALGQYQWGIEGRFVDYRDYRNWYNFYSLASQHSQFTRNGFTIAVSNGDASSVTVTLSMVPETGYDSYVISGYYLDITA